MRNALYSFLLLLLAVPTVEAVECVIPRDRHPWTAFRPGSWKVVQVTSETLDDTGKVLKTSLTETKTTLLAVDNNTYELLVETTVDVAGKRFASEPKIVRQGMYGENVGQAITVRTLPDTRVRLDQIEVPARATQVEIVEKDQRRVMVLSYSDTCRPHLLHRDTNVYDSQGKLLSHTSTNTHDLDANSDVLGKRCFTWKRRTEQKHPQGSLVIEETHCSEVPGGVVEHLSEEMDVAGKLIRRSSLKMMSFSTVPQDTVVRRRFPRRNRRENKAEGFE